MTISTIVFPAFKTTDRISTLYPRPPDTFENYLMGNLLVNLKQGIPMYFIVDVKLWSTYLMTKKNFLFCRFLSWDKNSNLTTY